MSVKQRIGAPAFAAVLGVCLSLATAAAGGGLLLDGGELRGLDWRGGAGDRLDDLPARAGTPDVGGPAVIHRYVLPGYAFDVEGSAKPPTPVPTPTVSPSGGQAVGAVYGVLTASQVRSLAAQAGFPEWELDTVVAKAWCESSFQPWVINGVMLGLMQISDRQGSWQGWWEYFGFDTSRYADALYNLQLAKLIRDYEDERGQRPWGNWEC